MVEHYKVPGPGIKQVLAHIALLLFMALLGVVVGATWHGEILSLLRSITNGTP